MAPAVRNLFEVGTKIYFDANVTFVGVTLSIREVLVKYNLYKILAFESDKCLNFAKRIRTCALLRPVLKICHLVISGP